MFRHNLLIAFRNLKRHKGSFFINLIGLSTGLACTFLIYLWVTDELGFDRFHTNDKYLYQVIQQSTENGSVIIHESTQGILASTMKKDLPEVANSVSVMSLQKYGMMVPMKAGDNVVKTTGTFADKEFFNIFSFPLQSGKPAEVLQQKEALVLSENLAVSMFGSPDKAVGKNIQWEVLGKKITSTVTGVFENTPANSTMQFDFVATYELLLNDLVPNFQKWWNEGPETYLLLKPGTDVAQFDKKIEKFINRYFSETHFTMFLRPFSSGYLYGKYDNGVQAGGRIEYVRLFSIIAIFILVIACINFMNLSTARASRRLKEVGIKKAIGSTRKALVFQFLSEAVFMALMSLIVAVTIVMLVLPVFNNITGKSLDIHFNPKIVSLALLTTFVTGLLSGSYPAFYMSGFNVISVFRGKLKKSIGELLARKGLVVFQFMISLSLIVAVMVIIKQVDFVQSRNLGYDKTNIIHFDKDGNLNTDSEAFLSELRNVPGVLSASTMQENVIQKGNGSSTYGITWPGKNENQLIDFAVRQVNYGLIETLGIDVVKGRSFSKKFGAESKALIFNETAIRLMGLRDPVGTKANMWGEEFTIIGVVKDFHITSLHEEISPLVFKLDPSRASTFMVKIAGAKSRETIAAIERLYTRFNSGFIFQYKFLDEVYQAQYLSEQRVATISKYFAALAIIISCLGLFGLAAFNAELRTKEIGIRKVLGATVSNVMMLLSKDFIVLILISMFIAFPLSWWAMNTWLNGFAYRINIGASVFVVAGLAMIVLALITVSYQSLRTALTNPVKSLRSE